MILLTAVPKVATGIDEEDNTDGDDNDECVVGGDNICGASGDG